MIKNVIVIFGGVSCEHDISILTAMQVVANIDAYLYKVTPVYIDKMGVAYAVKNIKNVINGKEKLNKKVIFEMGTSCMQIVHKMYHKRVVVYAAIVCMHGRNGEDGTIAGLLNHAGIAYTCPGVIGSSVGMDKIVFKDVLKTLGINYIDYITTDDVQYKLDKDNLIGSITKFGLPVIIKPASLGSSIGIEVCKSIENIDNCVQNALKYDKNVLIEHYIDKYQEINIAIYKKGKELIVSNIERPIKAADILSFDNKYITKMGLKGVKHGRPKLSKLDRTYIVNCAKKVYIHLNLSGVVRFDFMVADKVYLNEINTIPGSMANYLFNVSFTHLINDIIEQAKHEQNRAHSLTNYFGSSVLQKANNLKISK